MTEPGGRKTLSVSGRNSVCRASSRANILGDMEEVVKRGARIECEETYCKDDGK